MVCMRDSKGPSGGVSCEGVSGKGVVCAGSVVTGGFGKFLASKKHQPYSAVFA
jgi:hypothetical protein